MCYEESACKDVRVLLLQHQNIRSCRWQIQLYWSFALRDFRHLRRNKKQCQIYTSLCVYI